MSTASQAAPKNFKAVCRQWRQFRKLSQLDLALAANVSQRHVSWLETGLRQYIANWEQAAPAFIRRLKSEALASGDPVVQKEFDRYIELAGPMADNKPITESLLPVLPLELNINGLELSLFTVISTFGTPQDITTDELRIEAFYPTDTQTAEFFKSAA